MGEFIRGLSAGDYQVTVTDANGCIGEATFTVPFFEEPLFATITAEETENGVELTANPIGSGGPFSYLWSNGATTASIFPMGSAVYSVTITNSQGCQATAEFSYVGLESINSLHQSVFPNPFSEQITLKEIPSGSVVQLFGIEGKELLNLTVFQESIQLPTQAFSQGIYLLTLQYPNGKINHSRMIKQQ